MRGFSLIELLLVIGLIAVIATLGFITIYNFQQKQNIKLTMGQITAALRDAQNRAINGETPPGQTSLTAWGVHFDNQNSASPFFAVFYGDYSPATVVSLQTLPVGITYTQPTSTNNIYFSAISGTPSSSVLSINLDAKNLGSTLGDIQIFITVDANGRISQTTNPPL